MRPALFAGACWAVVAGLVAGCGAGAVPPDEALARARARGGDHAKLGADSTADQWANAAREYYKPAALDYFEDMDRVGGGEAPGSRKLELTENGVRGRNAWVLWTAGNEAWWDWLARYGYGTIDLLRLVDTAARDDRFAKTGLVNEPGTRLPSKDETEKSFGVRYARPIKPGDPEMDGNPAKAHVEYRPDRGAEWKPADDYVYGYPSGVVGLRLFKNPDFDAAAEARWRANLELYYKDDDAGRAYVADPDTVRPFRVGMSCGFCHIAPHPLHPPADKEHPTWADLSNNVGNQFMRIRAVFGNMLRPDNYLYHVFDAQLPGAVDTSGYPSDNNNNPNTINSFYGLPGRLARAPGNPPETISGDTLAYLKTFVPHEAVSPHHVPRVLLDGSDSVGVHVALARVYLNIGTHHQQWIRTHNPILGFRTQKPFKLRDTAANSLYWHATRIRVPYLAEFFTASTDPMRLRDAPPAKDKSALRGTGPDAGRPWYTAPGKEPPKDAGKQTPKADDYARGRDVFARGCIACHSSVQPGDREDFEVLLGGDVANTYPDKDANEPEGKRGTLTLPADPAKLSAGEKARLMAARRALALTPEDRARLARGDGSLPDGYARWAKQAVHKKEFWQWSAPDAKGKTTTVHNFLSIDERIPVTVTRTNSGRAAATNALHGHVWEDFASQTYRELAPVGAIRYRDPFSGAEKEYSPPGGGPGYYRVPTLISVWATAPFLHNNALGLFNNDPSVDGRLAAYEDGIARLLWPARRHEPSAQWYWPGGDKPAGFVPDAGFAGKQSPEPLPDRARTDGFATKQREADGGWVWRTTTECDLRFSGPHVPTLLGGRFGLSPTGMRLAAWGPALFFLALAAALLLAEWLVALRERLLGRLDWVFAPIRWAVAVGSFVLALAATYFAWKYWTWIEFLDEVTQESIWGFRVVAAVALPVLFLSAALLASVSRLRAGGIARRVLPRVAGAACLLVAVALAAGYGRFADGRGAGVRLGPIPAGVPVNILANLDPDAPVDRIVDAAKALMEYSRRQRGGADPAARRADFEAHVAPALMRVSKCPDFVTDRGHDYEFIRRLSDDDKRELIALIRTF
jgi:mono/diheme cytochrome c family protein